MHDINFLWQRPLILQDGILLSLSKNSTLNQDIFVLWMHRELCDSSLIIFINYLGVCVCECRHQWAMILAVIIIIISTNWSWQIYLQVNCIIIQFLTSCITNHGPLHGREYATSDSIPYDSCNSLGYLIIILFVFNHHCDQIIICSFVALRLHFTVFCFRHL